MRIGVLGAANIARKVVIPSILEAKGVELAAIASESTKASDFLAQTDLRTVSSSATGLNGYPAYAISIERGRQAPPTPTEIVGQGQVAS